MSQISSIERFLPQLLAKQKSAGNMSEASVKLRLAKNGNREEKIPRKELPIHTAKRLWQSLATNLAT